MKLKLKPSGSARKMYMLVEAGDKASIERAILDYIGVLGWAKASPLFVERARKRGGFILAVNRGEVTNIRAAFEACSSKIKVVKLSGTLKGLEK